MVTYKKVLPLIISKVYYRSQLYRLTKMNKFERKKIRRFLEEKKEALEALEKYRMFDEDLYFDNIGILKMRIIFNPSFEEGECWDFREIKSEKYLFFSKTSRNKINPGYFKIKIPKMDIISIYNQILKQRICLPISHFPNSGLDPTIYIFKIFVGFEEKISITWVDQEDKKPYWNELIELIESTLINLRKFEREEISFIDLIENYENLDYIYNNLFKNIYNE